MTLQTQRLRVSGLVQGVGFRPFVWRLAQELALRGWVRNDAQGVELLARGKSEQLAELARRLRTEAPPLARVDAVQLEPVDAVSAAELAHCSGFAIMDSRPGANTTAIGPDVAVCPECLAELFDPSNRRWRHPFVTCTHCGPRWTVTRALPYDRPQTSLAPFPLCPLCQAEYSNPLDRRFHAETTCCPLCGPGLQLSNLQGGAMPGDPIAQTLARLQAGAIVVIKGLGGFHLACDARNASAVARLRERKNREAKPLAVMVVNVASLAGLATVSAAEQTLLESRERPIVLLPLQPRGEAALPGVAPGLQRLGVMLPGTPIHFLLFHEAAGRPKGTTWLTEPQPLVLVMTSANPGGEPIVSDGLEARERLAGLADALLDHNREVVARCDDSVLTTSGGQPQFIRRSRGYAPTAIRLPHAGAPVLALGAYLKNTVCVTRGSEAFLSPHVGSLDNAATLAFQDEMVQRLLRLLQVRPALIAHDAHPDDPATRSALALAHTLGLPTLAVQHHHAHIAAVCAEHGCLAPVLGLALDGFGWGLDGTAWGGELLQVDGANFTRLGHLQPLAQPGGDRAAREPWRMAASVLQELGRGDEITQRFQQPAAATVATLLQRQSHSPLTSSLGRVFDAVAGLLGLCSCMDYEAQAPVLLEQAAMNYVVNSGWPEALPDGWMLDDDGRLSLLPLLARLADVDTPVGSAADQAVAKVTGSRSASALTDTAHARPIGSLAIGHAAAQFHATLVAGLAHWVMQAAQRTGIQVVALGGGCFLNSLLSSGLQQTLRLQGLSVLVPRLAPAGDGGLALGQAWVALQILEN
ncbi:MAG: carbamoyltransferase HypF [Rhodoferax ferrireducens]|uniref:Carbamoyltransferase HypF n=1 Tax=Rhodoferax ferrireducens TaxID=192843 RepID=A0A1W9KT40_9BURK|nr:MAG: carbamoyltransferase HypF [Rhodoferax ferrireducens]